MKAAPILVAWHNDNAPIYSAHFEPHGKGRLATGGGDNNVRLWKIDCSGDDRKVSYLSTLVRHAQAVNVVRWCPRGELLASASDDGNVILWVPSEIQSGTQVLGSDELEDRETWRVKRMCRSPTESEIYDLSWSPDGDYFVTGSMDNVARIYEAQSGNMVRQIAEHNHYVQGVAWDPLNEYLATQSSDRSVHIYTLRNHQGQFALAQHGKVSRMDLPPRRISASSPAPPDVSTRASFATDVTLNSNAIGSPAPSIPGTPTSLSVPMNPPPPVSHASHSRRSSIGSPTSIARSTSPAPSLPLPAVMPSPNPNPYLGLGLRNTNIYANETLTSFFRRLTFAPDGSLLFTPAGQYKTSHAATAGGTKPPDDIANTVYIYTRAGLNKPPVAHLPGHKKPSVAVRCSPIFYNLRSTTPTKHITIDTSSGTEDISDLPEPAMPSKPPKSTSSMEPPPLTSASSPSPSAPSASPKPSDGDSTTAPLPSFALPYRVIYAVATQDAVFVYDTQQSVPLCVVSNLHFATFTDLSWAGDGLTLLMASSDGFCSTLSFAPSELGSVYTPPKPPPQPLAAPPLDPSPYPPHTHTHAHSHKRQSPSSGSLPSPFSTSAPRPSSPARSNSASSIATQSSFAHTPSAPAPQQVINNPTPTFGAVPSVAAAHSGPVGLPAAGSMPLTTPPQTPTPTAPANATAATAAAAAAAAVAAPPQSTATASQAGGWHGPGKRGSESEGDAAAGAATGTGVKRRKIAPTLVMSGVDGMDDERAADGGGGKGGDVVEMGEADEAESR